jgi:GT2 family glycosyltransferase
MNEKEPCSISDIELSKVYAVIVTYNAKLWIKKCLESVINSTIEVGIIVADNASSDDTVDYIKKTFKNVKLIELGKNYGFGKANNIGISYALKEGADFIYLLNQDAWVKPDTIEILLKLQKNNPAFGVVSPIHVTASEDKLDYGFRDYCTPALCPSFSDDLFFNRRKPLYEIDFVNAAHWLISKECLMNVGGFSPSFYHYGEDNNFVHRVHYHGFKVCICPITLAIHDRECRKETETMKLYYDYYLKYVVIFSDINTKKNNDILLFIKLSFRVCFGVIKYKSLVPLFHFFKLIFLIPKIIYNNNASKKRFPTFLPPSF